MKGRQQAADQGAACDDTGATSGFGPDRGITWNTLCADMVAVSLSHLADSSVIYMTRRGGEM